MLNTDEKASIIVQLSIANLIFAAMLNTTLPMICKNIAPENSVPK